MAGHQDGFALPAKWVMTPPLQLHYPSSFHSPQVSVTQTQCSSGPDSALHLLRSHLHSRVPERSQTNKV